MQGREPPPRASHEFPNDPTHINKKFWGTQSMRGFIAFGGTIAGVWLSLLAFNAYLMRNEDRMFFFKIDTNPENLKRKMAIMEADGSYWHNFVKGFQSTQTQLFPDKNQSPDHDLRLDDSVKMIPPHMDKVEKLRIR